MSGSPSREGVPGADSALVLRAGHAVEGGGGGAKGWVGEGAPSADLAPVLCAATTAEGGAEGWIGDVVPSALLVSVLCAATAAECGAEVSGPIAAGAIDVGPAAAAADTEAADVASPPSAQVYTVLMEAGVTVAVVVYPAAVKVVVYVTTTVTGAVLVLGAELGVHAVPRSL